MGKSGEVVENYDKQFAGSHGGALQRLGEATETAVSRTVCQEVVR